MTETELSKKIRDLINAHPRGWAERVNAGRPGKQWTIGGATKGCADLLGTFYGHALAVEVKNPTGRNRHEPEQKVWRDRWVASGGVYAIVRTVEEMHAVLDRLAKIIT